MSFFGDSGKYVGPFCYVGDEWEISTSKHTQTMYFHVAQLLCSYLHPLWKNRFLKILKNRHFESFYCIFTVFQGKYGQKGRKKGVSKYGRILAYKILIILRKECRYEDSLNSVAFITNVDHVLTKFVYSNLLHLAALRFSGNLQKR